MTENLKKFWELKKDLNKEICRRRHGRGFREGRRGAGGVLVNKAQALHGEWQGGRVPIQGCHGRCQCRVRLLPDGRMTASVPLPCSGRNIKCLLEFTKFYSSKSLVMLFSLL